MMVAYNRNVMPMNSLNGDYCSVFLRVFADTLVAMVLIYDLDARVAPIQQPDRLGSAELERKMFHL